MIDITDNIKQSMAENGMFKVRRDKVLFQQEGKASITVPSKHYPLLNKKTIDYFDGYRTLPLGEAEAINAFNELSFEVGRCYENTQKIQRHFEQKGLGEHVKTMSGWLFSPGGAPMHHAWVVYKDKHVLDPAARVDYFELMNELSQKEEKVSLEKMRQLTIDMMKTNQNKPNHQTMTCGQTPPIYVYVGSETSPEEGRKVFQKLTKQYPNHPSYQAKGVNQYGESTLQRQLRDRF